MIDVRALIGRADILFVTLDTLRYDVAEDCLRRGRTPNLRARAARAAMGAAALAGQLHVRRAPGVLRRLPADAGEPSKAARPFAIRFPAEASIGERTAVFDAPDIVAGLAARGYHTVCIGGVGFFNPRSALGSVLPGLFAGEPLVAANSA